MCQMLVLALVSLLCRSVHILHIVTGRLWTISQAGRAVVGLWSARPTLAPPRRLRADLQALQRPLEFRCAHPDARSTLLTCARQLL